MTLGFWRDGGEWERFAGLWHPEGNVNATWFYNAPAAEVIARNRKAFKATGKALHTLGGSRVDVLGTRGVAQTKMATM